MFMNICGYVYEYIILYMVDFFDGLSNGLYEYDFCMLGWSIMRRMRGVGIPILIPRTTRNIVVVLSIMDG